MAALRLVPYGPQAALALRDAIVEAKAGDALAPVTVAVPSNYAGLSLRRRLGSGELSLAAVSGRDGLVNVRFLVLARVAELLGAPSLAAQGRRPLTAPVRAEAIRAALAADPGLFRDVAEHTATERSLDATFRDLRQAPPEALDAVAHRSPRAEQVVRLFLDFRRRTATYYDEEDLTLAAAEAVRNRSPALRDVGHVVLYLPRRLSPGERTLVEALAATGGLTAIIGLAGDAEADASARRLAAQLERVLGPAEEGAPQSAPVGTQIVAVTDAEEEVRTALRLIMERLAAGTPLHRMAVLYPSAQPYALLAHEQFHAAGVPHHGPSVRTLAQTLPGRTLLGLLRLREADFRRDAVMDWLSAAPLLERAGGSYAPAQRWEALSRSAGVVRGASQWRDRLARHRRVLEKKREALERMDEGDDWQFQRIKIDLEQVERLARFIDELVAGVEAAGRSTWAEFAPWARGLLQRYLGGEGHRRDWPDDEVEAYRAVEEALDALSALVDLRERTNETTFRRALERELEAPAARVGRFGDGVFVGRISDAMGTDFDVVCLVGMTEGLLPPRERDDPLLPDRERSAAGEELPLRTSRQAEERREYLAGLASAPERVLIFPRADLRGQRGKLPARWLLETASQLEGRTLFSSDLEPLSRPWHLAVPSFEAALTDGIEPASEQEYDLRSLLRWRSNRRPVTEHYVVANTPPLRAGLSAELARTSASLTRWDGRLPEGAAPAPSAERAISPTALQSWAACPFRYFLGHVLRVSETEKPEETLTLSALERGNLIHRALEEFVREAPPRATPDQPWSAEEWDLLLAIGERLCHEAEQAGLTGQPLLWKLARERILRDLAGFLNKDEELRAELGVVPAEVELSFGLRDADEPLVLSLEDGRSIAFRGRIDRVDRAPDGSRLLVLDYKTGSTSIYTRLHIDPVRRGKLLQLPIYALAARQRHGDVPVETYYWFVTESANYDRQGYPLAGPQLTAFQRALSVIVGGIEQGLFPARPGQSRNDGFENCQLCPYDRVCPGNRARVWGRKRSAPELREYLDLAEPED
jgi:RecB family exonuclease